MGSTGFWAQIARGKSPVRALMNRALAETGVWQGTVLDVGGTNTPPPSYRAFFQLAEGARVTLLNIDPEGHPDVVGDAAQIPMGDASCNGVWCLNLLEHVADPARVMHEMARVLKPGGRLVSFTPFLVRVHGHPDDYHRFTETALRRLAEGMGLRVEVIRAAGGGPFLASVSQVQAIFPRILFFPAVAISCWLDTIVRRVRPMIGASYPLGFLMIAHKV